MMPPRGPRRLLCVVVVTKSAVRDGAGMDAGGDQAGDVGHVDEEEGPGFVGDLAHAGKIDDARDKRRRRR